MSDDREDFEQEQLHQDQEGEAPPLKFGPTGELRNALAAKLRDLSGPFQGAESFDLAEEVMSLCGVDPGRECESGLESCGPATMSDSEGAPLCTRCFIGLALDAAAAPPALTIANLTDQEVTYTITPVEEPPACESCGDTSTGMPCKVSLCAKCAAKVAARAGGESSDEKLRMALLNLAASWYPPRQMAMEDCARELRETLTGGDESPVAATCDCCSDPAQADDDKFYAAPWCGTCGHPGAAHARPASAPAWTGADSLEPETGECPDRGEGGPHRWEPGADGSPDWCYYCEALRPACDSLERALAVAEEVGIGPGHWQGCDGAHGDGPCTCGHAAAKPAEPLPPREPRFGERLRKWLPDALSHMEEQIGHELKQLADDIDRDAASMITADDAADSLLAQRDALRQKVEEEVERLKYATGCTTMGEFDRAVDILEVEPFLERLGEIFGDRPEGLKKIKMDEDAKWFEVPGRDGAKGLTVGVNPDGSIGLWPMLPGEVALAGGSPAALDAAAPDTREDAGGEPRKQLLEVALHAMDDEPATERRERDLCPAHLEPEPCPTCAAYEAAGL